MPKFDDRCECFVYSDNIWQIPFAWKLRWKHKILLCFHKVFRHRRYKNSNGNHVSESYISFATKRILDKRFCCDCVRLSCHFCCYQRCLIEKAEKRSKVLFSFVSKSYKLQHILLFDNSINKQSIGEVYDSLLAKLLRESGAVEEISNGRWSSYPIQC